MTAWDALGPFQPGPGGMPPYLAGRETEQDLFRALLQRLRDRGPLPSEVILYGPRGNGKTVLLGWLRDEAAASETETAVLLPSGIPDVPRLSELLLPKSWWDRLTPEQVAAFGISWRPGAAGAPPPLDEILAARARKAPLLVVMDEAHTLDVEVGRALLSASQEVRRRFPFLLVLAGTPDLRGHLGAMGASFWSRMRKLRIGRLDEDASREGFARPFADAGIRVDDGALDEMVRLSDGYPYFIQLLGQKVWERLGWSAACGEAPPEVTPAVFEAARPGFEHARGDYYLHRFAEFRKQDLLKVARSVAAAFADREVLDVAAVERAVRSGLDDPSSDAAADRAELALADLGFIWGTSPTPGWEPGIPSLMDYILEFAPAP